MIVRVPMSVHRHIPSPHRNVSPILKSECFMGKLCRTDSAPHKLGSLCSHVVR
jgi:hypothetical protein